LVNHSRFKGALFMVVGIIDLQMGTRDIRRLGGLMALMPISFTVAIAGSFSMAGLPPFNGFLSKEMFFISVLNISHLVFFSIYYFVFLFPLVFMTSCFFSFIYCHYYVFIYYYIYF